MRRFTVGKLCPYARTLLLPWESKLPARSESCWFGIGKAVVEIASSCDTGKTAFEECRVARDQLETIIQSIGYDMNIYIFGGLVTLGILEVGGDVDFVGVFDIEPCFDESAEIVSRVCRELRRLGLKTKALPKARVPVLKADRVSKDLPGTPFHNLSCDGIFQFTQSLNSGERDSFEARLKETFDGRDIEWNASSQFATSRFCSTSALIYGLSNLKKHAGLDIPVRLPIDVRHGPELYRIPFDFCLSATGLSNSYLLCESLAKYPYSRHLLLTLKKWGRSSGVVNSIDGLLASYALTVMLTHFLVKTGVIDKVAPISSSMEPQVLHLSPNYKPLANGSDYDLSEVGYLLAAFLEYYGIVFNYSDSVVCTTNVTLSKKLMNWETSRNTSGKPPFFEFAIKDPYGLDNIGRNLDRPSVEYTKAAHKLALTYLLSRTSEPLAAVNALTRNPPRPKVMNRSLSSRGIIPSSSSSDQMEARHILTKMEFQERRRSLESFGKRAMKNNENQNVASNVTRNVLGWIRSDDS